MKLTWFKSDITNVESVEKWYYEYSIRLKLWKTCISVLCLFVDKKLLQNETSQISTDLIQNLKIKIISLSVLKQYFFENCHFHIISYLIISYWYRIISYRFLVPILWSRPCLVEVHSISCESTKFQKLHWSLTRL